MPKNTKKRKANQHADRIDSLSPSTKRSRVAKPNMRVIFGGSFDPIHKGHCQMIDHLCEQFPDAQIHIMPNNQSPFKTEATQAHVRVAMIEKNNLIDYESEKIKNERIKGNIYLAKIVRVEPSLQAAFVDYGGNKHGFLAYNEIHPDYFKIPTSDKKKLLQQELEASKIVPIDEDEEDFEDQQINNERVINQHNNSNERESERIGAESPPLREIQT